MAVTVFIRYQIDPFQLDAFREYAGELGPDHSRPAADTSSVISCRMKGTNDIAWGLISLPDLAAYEAYRARLRPDPAAQANFAHGAGKAFHPARGTDILERGRGNA